MTDADDGIVACLATIGGPLKVPGVPGNPQVYQFVMTDDWELAELIREALADGAMLISLDDQLWGGGQFVVLHDQ